MKLGFEEPQTPYSSGSQSARAWTERWVGSWIYCPNCGSAKLDQFTANRPVADFQCSSCAEEYELKSQKGSFGKKVVDGAYHTMCDRLASLNNPNLMLLNYNKARLEVTDVCVVPKQFFTREIVEERKPLSLTARRAGWVGCNILLDRIPSAGKIFFVRNGVAEPKDDVVAKWRQTFFLRGQNEHSRGWLIEVLKCVESIRSTEFELSEVYKFEDHLQGIFPDNMHVRPKIRQQLQFLRDSGLLEFVARGRYRMQSFGTELNGLSRHIEIETA